MTVLLVLCLFGAPMIGLIAPFISARYFRLRSMRPPIVGIVAALLVWIAACVVAGQWLVYVGFAYAWEGAHAQRDTGGPLRWSEHLRLGGLTIGILVALGVCAAIIHRVLIALARRRRAALG